MRHRRYWLLAGLGLIFGLGIPLLIGGRELLPAFRMIPWTLPGLLVVMILAAWNFNVGRVKLLVGGMGKTAAYRQVLAAVMATEFAFCATPGGTGGHVTYSYLLGRFGLSMPQGLGLCAVDQLMDVLFFITSLAGVMLYWLIRPESLHPGWQLCSLGVLMLVVVLCAWLFFRFFRCFLGCFNAILRRLKISPGRRHDLRRWMMEFHRSLQVVRQFSRLRLLGVYLFCLGYWLLRYSVLFVVVRSLGGRLSWSYCFLAQMFSHTVGQATMVPGGSGGAEVSSGLFLVPVLGGAKAAAAILLWRFATFYFYLAVGGPVFAWVAGRPLWQRLVHRARKEEEGVQDESCRKES